MNKALINFLEQNKFKRVQIIYRCDIGCDIVDRRAVFDQMSNSVHKLQSYLPQGWTIMSYGPLVNGSGVDIVLANPLSVPSLKVVIEI